MANISQIKLPNGTTYDIDAVTVDGHSVNADVPSGAVFTDEKVQQDPIYPSDNTADVDRNILLCFAHTNLSRISSIVMSANGFYYNIKKSLLKILKYNSSTGEDDGIQISATDIEKVGTGNTWDGTNTSLQTSISAINASLVDFVDLTKWNHITGTVSTSTTSANFTEQTVNAIKTAKICIIKIGRTQFEFRNDGSNEWQAKTNYTNLSASTQYSVGYSAKCDFSNGVVGVRLDVKGTSITSVALTDIWYL